MTKSKRCCNAYRRLDTWSKGASMPKILANGLNLHYLQVGSGPHVIMVHGLTGNLAVWHFTAIPALRERYRITTFDLRGHGRSDMPPTGYTTRAMAEDLR